MMKLLWFTTGTASDLSLLGDLISLTATCTSFAAESGSCAQVFFAPISIFLTLGTVKLESVVSTDFTLISFPRPAASTRAALVSLDVSYTK